MDTLQIWTIGHSTRSIEDFIGLLNGHQIKVLVDVRRFPGSRRYPQFNSEQLSESLTKAGLEYLHFPELGGMRKARKDSLNTGLRNESFRGYADYMETKDFANGIERLLRVVEKNRTAIMCAEAVWWQCHRSLIADFLKCKGVKVWHILGEKKLEEHPFTSAARVVAGKLTYAPAVTKEFEFH